MPTACHEGHDGHDGHGGQQWARAPVVDRREPIAAAACSVSVLIFPVVLRPI
jgi:hypothetical protein